MQQSMSGPWPSVPADASPRSAIQPALRTLIERFGTSILDDGGRLKGLLADECPHDKREISILMQALAHNVPQDLMRVRSGEPIQSLSPRLVKRLSEEQAMAPDASAWAVQTWAYGLGLGDAAGDVATAPSGWATAGQTVPAFRTAVNDTGMRTPLPQPVPGSAALAIPTMSAATKYGGAGVLAAIAAVVLWLFVFQPKLDIVGVQTQGVFVANGKPVKLLLDVDARRVNARSIDVRFVRGDGDWRPTSWSFPIASPAGSARLEGATLAYASSRPMRATFEFVVVAADGTRSPPFERTFDIAPPVVLESAVLSVPARVGQELAFDLRYRKGSSEITQVEGRVVEGSPTWSQSEWVTRTKLDQLSGSVTVRADPVTAPSRFTMEFVLIDAQGVRSEPQRVAVDVQPNVRGTGPGTIVRVSTVTSRGRAAGGLPSGAPTAIGAAVGGVLGSQIGGGSGRVAGAVAGAASGGYLGYQFEGGPATVSTVIDVRLDDGSSRQITQPGGPRFATGERVFVGSGNALSRL